MGPGPIWARAHNMGQGPFGPGPGPFPMGGNILRKCILENTNMFYLSYGCLRMCFYASWQHFTNMGSPANLTTSARTTSKFCSWNWSQSRDIFDLDLISEVIPGIIEPGPECHSVH